MTRWHPNKPSVGFDRAVGILGGSFNPAHDGHLYISVEALRRLGLDEIWWLVSPQNPLKGSEGMAGAGERFASAVDQATHPAIRVTDIEAELETTYTAETLVKLRQEFPKTKFVWLMGADNLAQIPEWKDWPQIFHTVPVAVFDRPDYASRALAGAAAVRFAGQRLAEERARALVRMKPPAWVFLHVKPHPASATEIRARRGAEWRTKN